MGTLGANITVQGLVNGNVFNATVNITIIEPSAARVGG